MTRHLVLESLKDIITNRCSNLDIFSRYHTKIGLSICTPFTYPRGVHSLSLTIYCKRGAHFCTKTIIAAIVPLRPLLAIDIFTIKTKERDAGLRKMSADAGEFTSINLLAGEASFPACFLAEWGRPWLLVC